MTHQTSDLYRPLPARITDVQVLSATERFYRLSLPAPLGHRPGQFVMLGLLGLGEAPISISTGPRDDRVLELCVREAGSLTRAIHRLGAGDTLWVRGPYGSGFDLAEFEGKQALLVAGGLGLAPLRSLIEPLVADRQRFPRVTVISGSRNPGTELYRPDLARWAATPGVQVIRLVDRTEHMPWDHQVGLVTAPIPGLDLDVSNTVAALCGPPVMYKFVVFELLQKGLSTDRIFVDLERRMRCGVGKCGHCQINHLTCCTEGPVFRLSDLERLPEAFR